MKLSNMMVNLGEVELKDESFRYSDDRFDRKIMIESIRCCGILNPVVLTGDQKNYQVVAGFRRLQIAQELGMVNVPAYLANKKIGSEDLFRLSLLENQTARSLNLVEKATLFLKLQEAGIDQDRIVDLFLPLVGLPHSWQKVNELMIITELPEILVDYFILRGFSVRRLRHLKGLSVSSLAFFAKIVELLAPSANLFEEISREIVEVAQRDDTSVEEIAAGDLSELIRDESVLPSERLRILRCKVFSMRYPVLDTETRKLERKLNSLEIPSNAKLKWDRTLEAKGIEMRFMIDDHKDLEESIEYLKRFQSEELLNSITST